LQRRSICYSCVRSPVGTDLLITGDAFEEATPCDATGDPQHNAIATSCTDGLHTIAMATAVIRLRYARLERCGQRGRLGRYCAHTHLLFDCPECLFEGNAFEFGMQRGLVLHGTHNAQVTHNVFSDVRGAGLYIEDGNEVQNAVMHNAVVCPWPLDGPKGGCTVPGTDNHEADTSLNQAGLWALGSANHLVGNRFANSFNGWFLMSTFANGGRGFAEGRLCVDAQQFGRIEGNTAHGHGRFGTYLLGPNFPRHTQQSVASNGFQNLSQCGGFDASGAERGAPQALWHNVDWRNKFVGQYDAGDIQYHEHTSVECANLLYWKTTKNSADGCAAHLSGGLWRDGNVGLPDQATFVIDGARFEGQSWLEANHHCGESGGLNCATGVLCMPTYVLHNVSWHSRAPHWVLFQQPGAPTFPLHGVATMGGIFSLSPPEEANIDGGFLPPGFCALCAGTYAFLLGLQMDGGDTGDGSGGAICVTADSLGLGARYHWGILCRRPLRALKVYSLDQDVDSQADAPALLLEVWRGGAAG
jgi:hypothetical protein